jgi:tetratricopeptide (TPR) repeat protein
MRAVLVVAAVLVTVVVPPAAAAPNGDQTACETGKGDDAIVACSRLIEIGQKDQGALAAVHYRRGRAYLAMYQRPAAIADFNAAIDLNADFAEAYLARAEANRFNNHDKERLARVLADYTRAIELKPEFFDAYYYRGTLYDWLKDRDLALVDYDRALALKPGDISTLHMRARLHQHLGNYDRALADYDELIRLDSWVNRYLDRGNVYLALGDYDHALADYEEVTRRKPGDPSAHGGRAAVFERKGEFDRALAEINEAIRIAPSAAGFYSERAWTYYRMGRLVEGLADIDQILAAGWAMSAHTYDVRAHLLEALGRPDDAVADFRKALSLDPPKCVRDQIIAGLARLRA